MRSQAIEQVGLILSTTDVACGSFFGRGFLLICLMLLRAVRAEQASSWARLTIGGHGETLLANFTICQLAGLWSLSFFVDLICQVLIIIIRVIVPIKTSLALCKLLAVFDSCNGLLSLSLFDQVFR